MVGNPMQAARVYNSRNVDELIFVDIFATRQKRKLNLSVVKQVINECFMPVTIGGSITSIEDIQNLLQIGADKVVLKSVALQNPGFIKEAVKVFGSQCIVVSVDIHKHETGLKIFEEENKNARDATDFIREVEDLGAGELFICDVLNDGMMNGFDTGLFNTLSRHTKLPIIACGGGGVPDHFPPLLENPNITGIAASSIFHFTQYTPFDIKFSINKKGYPVRLFDNHLNDGVNL